MGYNLWGVITDPTLKQAIVHHFVTVASTFNDPESCLNRLEVHWMMIHKDPDPPEHKYMIMNTKDLKDNKQRLFILNHVVSKLNHDSEQPRAKGITTKENSNTQASTYNFFKGLSNLVSPSDSITTLLSMEEGKLTFSSTSTLYPPIYISDPPHSMGNVISLSTTKALQVVLESLDKDGKIQMRGFDQVLGNSYVNDPWYSKGQKALELRPNSLTFFELIILAQTVHEFALQYLTLEKNCYWFCNMVFHACKVVYGQCSQDGNNPHWHHLEILGR
jgi:hypothetical protein